MLLWFTRAAMLCLAAAMLAGLLQALHPAFDSFSHFRQFWVFFWLLLLPVALWLRLFLLVGGTGILALAAVYPTLSGSLLRADAVAGGSNQATIKMVQANLLFNNHRLDLAVSTLRQANADVILLQEINPSTRIVVQQLRSQYPFIVDCSVGGARHAPGILSRLPIADDSAACWPELLAAKASVHFSDKKITFVNVHLTWPWPQQQWRHIEQLGRNAFQPTDHLVIAGDFNASPWSNAMQKIERLSGTKLSTPVGHTWLPKMAGWDVAPPAVLTLDHTLVSDDLQVVALHRLNEIGSDHLPIVTEFALFD